MEARALASPFRLIVAIAAAATMIVALALVQTAGAEAKVRKGPGKLAFYKPPKHLPKGHGKLIWARRAGGLVPLSSASSTRLVLYTSRTPQGQIRAVSGSVSVPKGKPPKNGWPVISYAHGTTGVADACAPSRSRNGGPVVAYTSYVDPQLNAWLAAGYAVVRTDYQGLGTPGPHPFLVGAAEGRSVLDIVRAAHRLNPHISKRFLIAGHSQGGHAALFAAGLAKGYTPDLRLRGTASYAPASHILEQKGSLEALTEPSSLSALATLIVSGASTASAGVKPKLLLSDPAFALYPQLGKRCLSQLAESDSYGGLAPSDLLRDGANTGALDKVLAKMNPLIKTSAPIFIAQGTADTTVYQPFTDALNTELVNRGNNVTYTLYPGVDHGSIVAAAEGDALPFFQQFLPAG